MENDDPGCPIGVFLIVGGVSLFWFGVGLFIGLNMTRGGL